MRLIFAALVALTAAVSAAYAAADTAIHRADNDLATAKETEGEKQPVPAAVAAKTGASDSIFMVTAPRDLRLFLAWKGTHVSAVFFNPKTGNVSETPVEIEEEFLGAGLKAANRPVPIIQRPYVSFMESHQEGAVYLLIKRAAHQNTWSAGQTFVYRLGSDLSISESFCLETTSCPCALEKNIPCVFTRTIKAFYPDEARIEVRKECDEGAGISGSFTIGLGQKKLQLMDLAVTEKEAISSLIPLGTNACSREAGVSMVSAPGGRR